ncbi:MAG: glutathione S-transferase N-terminal domain-containing protein [Pseudomonadota bacterium]
MSRPVLYSFRRCPYAMRARMALIIAGIEVELREVVLRNKPPEMIAASPKATVPVMITDTGETLEESLDVMLWALQRHDPEGWLPDSDPDNRADIPDLLSTLEARFKPRLDRYKYPTRFPGEQSGENRDAGLAYLIEHLAPRLARHANLQGEMRTLADIGAFPFVRQFANTDKDWWTTTAPKPLQDWLTRHVESDLFLKAMVKHAPWQSGTPGVVFPKPFEAVGNSAMIAG